MMKTKTSHILFFILSLSSVLFFSNCQKQNPCRATVHSYNNISADEKSKIPYIGTDTLVFISNTSDTAKLIGQGKSSYYNVIQDHSNPDCPAQSENDYEINKFSFTGTNNFLSSIDYTVSMGDIPGYNQSLVHINIINKPFQSYALIDIFKDTLQIGVKTYQGIILKGSATNNTSDYIFYSYPEGILKIYFSNNNQTWLKQ